jgi:PKD repeat protein
MTNRLRFLHFFLFVFCLNLSYQIDAQVFNGEKIPYMSTELQGIFTACEVFRIDAEPLANFVRTAPGEQTTLVLGDHVWDLTLTTSDLLSTTYYSSVETPQGTHISHKRPDIAFKGYEIGGGKVRLTLDKGFIYGYVQQNNLVWRIEPLRYVEAGAADNLYVVYEKSNVVPNPAVHCGVTEEMEKAAHLDLEKPEPQSGADFLAVHELELAIASDQLMVAAYGSTGAVESHNIGVINDVEGDYTGSFNHDICFNIVTQYIATSFPGPWSASNDAGTLLGSFAGWGNAGNFGVTFDIGELWTDRDFDGGTVGIAYLNGVCNGNKYHCLQDFSSNSEFIRCMTSHELGHNFSATHDNGCSGGEFIMCPFVSSSSTWSAQSQSQMNPYIQSKINSGCLSSCVAGPPLLSVFDWSPEPGCVGQPVQFTDESTGVIASWTWTFTGGTPATSTQQNPSVTFNTPGPHNVALVVAGPGGNTAASSQVITIDPLPVSNFTYTVDDLTFFFTNTSSNADTYFWEFGDGSESTETDPTYSYSEAGIYIVKLTATNHCASTVKTLTINTFPAPNFTAEPTSGCATLLVQMVNESSSNSTSYQWQFPGGSPASSSQPNPVVLYTTSGTYSISLTAFNNSGSNTYTRTNYITVQAGPAPGFSSSTNGLTVTFNNNSVNSTSYLWNFGDGGTSTLSDPIHTYTNGGSYTVTLTAMNNCGSVVLTKTVVVSPPPVAMFSTSGNSGCTPLTVVFTNASTGATSYSWAFPGGDPVSSTETNPTVVFANPGAYTVTLTATNTSGNSTATATITVGSVPSVGFSSSNNGAVVSFTNSSNNASSYAWDFGDDSTGTETDPAHTYATDGVYTVVLTATNACGSVTTTQTVTVVTPPTAGFTASPTSGCAALIVQFTNASSANTTTFNWVFPGGDPATSTLQNPVVLYNTPGIYPVTLVAGNSAGDNTLTQTDYVSVNTVPMAGFTNTENGTTVTFVNTSNNAVSYGWDFGDGSNSTEANPIHTYTSDGSYTVTLTASNDCGSVTTTTTVTITSAPIAGFNATQTIGCAPFTVQFNNTSSSNATSFDWQFPGGAPSSSTDQNPVVVYNAPGLYSVSMSASNAAGTSTASQVDYISVGNIPNASFTSTVAGSTATFMNTSFDGTSFAWDFGDGNSSNDNNPEHTYTADGTYTVLLTATNNCGVSTFTQNVVVITDTEAGFTANTTSGCGPLSVQFSDLSSENTSSWNWAFPGGIPSTSTDQNPTVVYPTSGLYDVTLIASGPGGSSTFTQANFITVLGQPTGGFNSAANQNTVTFTNTSTDATSYLWTFGDGNSSIESSPSHTYTSDGTYTVILAATNNCGTTIVEQTVSILTAPVAAFTFSSGMGCAPLAVLFNNTSSSNATSFSWFFDGGAPGTSADQNPVSTWNTAGVYLVTLTASNAAGSSTASALITVGIAPTAGFSTQAAGLSIVTNNLTQNADSYTWSFGDGNTSTAYNPVHTYAATGTYTVVLEATNSCGVSTFSQVVTIAGSAPIAAFSSDIAAGCAGMTVQFNDHSAGDPSGWEWTFEGGNPATSIEQNPMVTYALPGTYSVTLTASNIFGGNSTQLTNYIQVTLPPTAGFSFTTNGGVVNFANSAQGATDYAWSFGDGSTSTEKDPVHTYTASGSYTVGLTVTNACGASTLQLTVVVVVVGIHETPWLNQFRLFPNPNMGRFTVDMLGSPDSNVEFTLFNSLGQVVFTDVEDFRSGQLTKIFDLNHLPAAVYSLRIQANGTAAYVKVVVEK